MKKTLLLLASLFLLNSCAGYPDVRPGEDGVHRVVIPTDDVEVANRSAIRQSNNYCEEFQKKAYFLTETKKYSGSIDENTYNTGKGISKAAKIFGGGILASSDSKNQQQTGKTVGLGGLAMDEALGKGYTVEMKFKCH
ncbi:MAG: hypothetical protein H7281_14765 [Bacteriovorax sp.]|nr:hypothetical protein [Bacteriovorax sp.]